MPEDKEILSAMAEKPAVLDTIAQQRGAGLFETAQKEYPYLQGKDVAFKYSPQQNPEYMLEFYKGGDLPEWAKGRQTAIEVFNPKTTPLDILGDYVSHYGVETDPKLQQLYQQFQSQLDPKAMQERYQYHADNFGENRPYEQWYQMTGLPEIFRGYTFNQFENAKEMYSPEQLKTLDLVRSYLGIK
jgi:hypothetical protein